jgi:hypothetical protein
MLEKCKRVGEETSVTNCSQSGNPDITWVFTDLKLVYLRVLIGFNNS